MLITRILVMEAGVEQEGRGLTCGEEPLDKGLSPDELKDLSTISLSLGGQEPRLYEVVERRICPPPGMPILIVRKTKNKA